MGARATTTKHKSGDEAPRVVIAASIRNQRRAGAVLGLSLLLMTLVAYLPAIRCGFIWDDDMYVQENEALRSAGGLRDIWVHIGTTPQYYPVVFTSFWLEYQIWGLDPAGYHAVNIVLHGLGAILLWRTLRRLGVPGAWLAGALFALHPVHVESVAWVTERKNVLSGVFYFAAALVYLRGLIPEQGRPVDLNPSHGWRRYLTVLLLFVCALLSKTVTCTLPAALLLVVWWKRGRLAWRQVIPLLPFFVIGAGMGLLTAWMEKHSVGAVGGQWDFSFIERSLVAGRAVWFYLGKLILPYPLIFIYPRWTIDAGQWRQYLPPLTVAAVAASLWLARGLVGRGVLTAALFFVGTLFPALGFFNVFPMRYSFVADHFQYLASVGPIALAAGVGWAAALRYGRLGRKVGIVASVLLLATMGALTWRQVAMYTDVEELWRRTIAANPRAWMAWNNLGMILKSRGEIDQAMSCYQRALAIDPDASEPNSNVGFILCQQGRIEEGLQHFHRAIQAMPNSAVGHYNMAVAMQRQGLHDEAIKYVRTTLTVEPNFAKAHHLLGVSLRTQGKIDEALKEYSEAIRLAPAYVLAYYNRGRALAAVGRYAEAREDFHQAYKLNRNWAPPLEFAAWMLAVNPEARVRDPAQAVRLAEEAATVTNRQDTRALDTLAAAYAAAERFDRAVATAREALDLARTTNAAEEARRIAEHLKLFEQGLPLREAVSVRDVAPATSVTP